MKRANWVRLIAMILVISMLAAPVSAATFGGPGHSTNGLIGSIIGIIKDIIIEIIDDWFDIPGVGDPDPTEPPVPTTPEEPTAPSEPVVTDPTEPEVTEPEETEPEVTEPVETEPAVETVLELIEGYDTVENGYMLRGTTYSLNTISNEISPLASKAILRKNVVALNAATDVTTTAVTDVPLTITFDNNGNAIIPDGDYVAHHNEGVGSYLTVNSDYSSPWGQKALLAAMDKASASYLTFTRLDDGTYTIQGPGKWYLCIPANNQAYTQADSRAIKITAHANGGIILTDTETNLSLNALDYINQYPKGRGYFGGWTDGSPFTLYPVTDTEGETPEQPEEPEVPVMPETSTVVYFPVTMFNYNTEAINNATMAMEYDSDSETWDGIYFSDGTPSDYIGKTYTVTTETGESTTKYEVTYTLVELTNGSITDSMNTTDEYILVNKRSGRAVTVGTSTQSTSMKLVDSGDLGLGRPISSAPGSITVLYDTVNADSASLWKYYTYNSSRYFRTASSNAYMTFSTTSSGTNTSRYSGTKLTFGTWSADSNAFTIRNSNTYLSDHSGNNRDFYCGLNDDDDDGNPFYLYKKTSTREIETENTITQEYTKEFAGHNFFRKAPGNTTVAPNSNGDLIWTGMVESQLDDNKIVFKTADAGIFSYDPNALNDNHYDGIKYVYEYVGMPFVLNKEGVYSFDSDKNGVYFKDTTGDNEPDPDSGEYGKPNNLDFHYGVTQDLPLNVADGSTDGWFPYDYDTSSVDKLTYHFGMRADLPFSLTTNGRVKSYDDTSTPISFTFSGDDDVWIFIDGTLVVDLGGLHNRLDITIDFAANTITYSEHNDFDTNSDTNSFNDAKNWNAVQKLFTDSEGTGLIDMTRAEFAVDANHTLQFFYLERGRGTSNCRVEFNLPMLDTLSVTKVANKSWSQAADDADKDAHDGTSLLTAKEQAAVNKLNFGFTLYKKVAGSSTFEPVASTRYYLVDADGNVMYDENGSPLIGSTNENGHFTLKNGQTAKFMTNMPVNGVTYYVVEDAVPEGFLTPDFMYDGQAANGFTWIDDEGELHDDKVDDAEALGEHELPMDAELNKSYVVTAYGSIEAADSLQFICINYLNADLPNPTALAMEDTIVIDYGLSVHIDPLANDVFRGDNIEIIAWGDESLGLEKTKGTDGFLESYQITNGVMVGQENQTYQPTFHSGTVEFINKNYDDTDRANVVRDTFDYTLNKQLTEVEVISYVVKVSSTTHTEVGDDQILTNTEYDVALAKVYIVPATIMYYEEDFTGLIQVLNSTGDILPAEINTTYVSDFQEPGVVGTVNDSTYGSDVAYLHDSEDSNGTSMHFDTTSGYVRFQYTFTGTGTTFFARTGADTGYMQVLLFKGVMEPDENGNVSHYSGKQMATYYRDTYFEDTEELLPDEGDTLYNIPVYTVDGLTYGTYTVLVTVAKAGTPGAGPGTPTTNAKKHNCFDENGESIAVEANTPNHVCRNNEGDVLYTKGSGNKFYLDGVRVMQPLNEKSREDLVVRALDAYDIDFETNLDVITLRQKLITDVEDGVVNWDRIHYVMLTDTIGTVVKPEDYIDCGPKEEVYLAPGQTVTFSLKYWHPEGLKLYMGMKAPFGEASLNVGKPPYTLYNTVDSYFDVTQDYASLITDKEPVTDTYGNPMYYDADGKFYIKAKDANGNYYFCDEEYKVVDVDENNLTLLEREYNIVTYTFTATDSIVSLTNIKVVGSYEFTIVPGYDIHIPGSEGGSTENGGTGEGTPDEGTPDREEEQP